jgi:ubiquitin C-terminal hydrolase
MAITLRTQTLVAGPMYCEAHKGTTLSHYSHVVKLHGTDTVMCDTCKRIVDGLFKLAVTVLSDSDIWTDS